MTDELIWLVSQHRIVAIYVYGTMINWFTLIKKLMQTSIVIVSGSIINASTVHLNGIWHLIWRYISKPVLGGHYSIPRGCPLNTGFTVKHYENLWNPVTSNPPYFNTCLPVSELSEYGTRSLLGQRFSFAKVRARGSHGTDAWYAQLVTDSSYFVVIIEAPYLLGSQPSALIINSLQALDWWSKEFRINGGGRN